MGHIAHLRKQFKSINTYDYHNADKEKKRPLFILWEVNGSSIEHIWVFITQECFVPNLVEIGLVVLE